MIGTNTTAYFDRMSAEESKSFVKLRPKKKNKIKSRFCFFPRKTSTKDEIFASGWTLVVIERERGRGEREKRAR